MKLLSIYLKSAAIAVLMVLFTGCEKDELNEQLFEADAKVKVPTAEAAGNNLSFPVFWAEGIPKTTLRTAPGDAVDGVLLDGAWWYVWGTDPADPSFPIYSCAPSPIGDLLCIDQTNPGTDGGLYKAWLQKDARNYWEAFNANATDPVFVDFIDWGDNLESIDWSIQSRVRTELVLYENVSGQKGEDDLFLETVTQYPMRHVSGWGTDEVHGLQTDLDGVIQFDNVTGDQATVYSTHTRMTIQKLNVDRDDPNMVQLEWDALNSKWIDGVDDDILVINEPIFSNALFEAGDGPGFFNAEVNVKGKIIYGYTWDVKKMNEGTGDYRITYSFDQTAPNSAGLNTFITEADILVPIEEVSTAAEEEETGKGGVGMLDVDNNLTYMDIRIVGRTTGGGGGNSGGGNGGGGNNSGGGGNGNGGGRN